MCHLCFEDSPTENDPHAGNPNEFQIQMADAPCKEPKCFAISFVCCCCSAYQMRKEALNNDMSRYRCCQGYFCWSGCGEEKAPEISLALETCLCLGPAVSATRMLVMDERKLMADPCDHQIIRFNNCMQGLSCICDILALFDKSFKDAANLIDLISQLVFYTVQACMTTQTYVELQRDPPLLHGGGVQAHAPPTSLHMEERYEQQQQYHEQQQQYHEQQQHHEQQHDHDDAGANFCTSCGAKRADPDSHFCGACGHAL